MPPRRAATKRKAPAPPTRSSKRARAAAASSEEEESSDSGSSLSSSDASSSSSSSSSGSPSRRRQRRRASQKAHAAAAVRVASGVRTSAGFRKLQKEDPVVLEEAVGKVMRFILFRSASDMPSKYSEINRAVLNNTRAKGMARDVTGLARRRFSTLLGYELVSIPTPDVTLKLAEGLQAGRKAKKNAKKKSVSTMDTGVVLRNPHLHRSVVHMWHEHDDDVRLATQGFLATLLCMIQLEQGVIAEVDLLHMIDEQLGVGSGRGLHPVLGPIDILLKTFIKQRYIIRRRMTEEKARTMANKIKDPRDAYEYTLGQHAFGSTSPTELYYFMKERVFGSRLDPETDSRLREMRKAEVKAWENKLVGFFAMPEGRPLDDSDDDDEEDVVVAR